MNILFTADMHLGHGNIIKYANRPYKDVYEMHEKLINNWNSRVKEHDKVIHIGDFCCIGNERGIEGFRTKAKEWEIKLNGEIIHILGNHDLNNNVKFGFDSATISFGGMQWLLKHRPMTYDEPIPEVKRILCGHVHEKWIYKIIRGVIHINVGVDVNNYRPITKKDINNKYQKIIRSKL